MPISIPEGENLVTYYILPLVGVNKLTFGQKFKTSYINKEGTSVFVELTSKMTSEGHTRLPCYITEVQINNKTMLLFKVPMEFYPDVLLFIKGSYSKMSLGAKKIIYAGSSLKYNVKIGDFKVSSPILQALDKTKTLRQHLLDTLGIKTLPETFELIDLPNESWFIESQIQK